MTDTEHTCGVIPHLSEDKKVLWWECAECNMKYLPNDVEVPKDYCIGFATTE